MIRSPYATRMTMFGVRDPDNKRRRGYKPTPFNPTKEQQLHHERYLEAVAAGK